MPRSSVDSAFPFEGHPLFAHPISVHMERKIRRVLSVAPVPFVMPMFMPVDVFDPQRRRVCQKLICADITISAYSLRVTRVHPGPNTAEWVINESMKKVLTLNN
jgi:hypothetical protein